MTHTEWQGGAAVAATMPPLPDTEMTDQEQEERKKELIMEKKLRACRVNILPRSADYFTGPAPIPPPVSKRPPPPAPIPSAVQKAAQPADLSHTSQL